MMIIGCGKIIMLGVGEEDSLSLPSLLASENPFRLCIALLTMETWIWSKRVL